MSEVSKVSEASEGVRLQKVLAGAGVGSRRACEDLIAAGRVTVDGSVVTTQGVRVDPANAVVTVDGKRVSVRADLTHLIFNKPRGIVSTMSDEQGRPAVGDYVREPGLFHVGRLDADSEGLLLLTNDGPLAHRLAHPSFEVPKTYLAEIPAPVPRDLGRRLRNGVELEDGTARADSFRVLNQVAGRAQVEVVLHEGRKHIVRRMLEEVDRPVSRLVRTAIGPVQLGAQRPGSFRAVNSKELGQLYELTGL
ncbi:MAG: rRNA pseudouridine synthase [Geodermatophilaceae bacterium]|nr:rRNA pseudouridine synthase [Geodermatophilaceae bacterium]